MIDLQGPCIGLQVETSSLHLFSVAIWGIVIINYFSLIHTLHRLLRFEYALAFARIFQDTVNSSFSVNDVIYVSKRNILL